MKRDILGVIGLFCLLLTNVTFAGAGQNIVPHDLKAEYERPVTIPAPDTNPVTDAKVRLGEILFSDPRLSI
ncbi:MAG: hypothetical protein AAGE61_10270, partial [Pseudomonadota bacterium]